MGRTAVVTGLGVFAPNGTGVEEYWRATLAGESGIGAVTLFDTAGYPVRRAGEITGFDAAAHLPGRLLPQTDRWTHLALAATRLGLDDAGADPADFGEYEMGVVTASSSGGSDFGQREIERLWSKGPQWVGAYQSIAWFYAATTGQVSIRHGMRGPSSVVAAEQAGAIDAVAAARRVIGDGAALVVSGGTDSALCPYGWVTQVVRTDISTDGTYRPFDAAASGFLPGEGGAMIIVEPADAAEARGARSYGEIAGHASSFDPPPWSTRPPTLATAIRGALADAGIGPDDVDVVFADAAGVPDLDRREAAALAEVFGPEGVPVTAPKTMTGRAYAGASLDLAAALLALRDNVIPPTIGVGDPVPGYRLDLVRDQPREAELATALVLARGHGGFNSALVLRGGHRSGGAR
ncbi:ketosynthase chain-length factor [Amycolatopsis sp. NPDC021455]|uniref:ketosynthase chain-length factor n=1 Tax=Amycolatopsis sp. NPDC021455 TaxID=3154901 RepID=UPI0033D6A555